MISGITDHSSASYRDSERSHCGLTLVPRPRSQKCSFGRKRDLLYMGAMRSMLSSAAAVTPRRYIANAHCRLFLGNALL